MMSECIAQRAFLTQGTHPTPLTLFVHRSSSHVSFSRNTSDDCSDSVCVGLGQSMRDLSVSNHSGHSRRVVAAIRDLLSDWCVGNKNFALGVDFSTAFKLLLGHGWYAVAETLFLLSCLVQASSVIVQTAQCLDSLFGSFFFKKTFALQLYPAVRLLSWSGEDSCRGDSSGSPEDDLAGCTPFSSGGPLVISLGYLLVTALFLPLGRGHIKETIWVQTSAFFVMFLLMGVFIHEFLTNSGGLDHPMPWVGEDFSRLGGVILFNYAFSVTVPAWLEEKKTHVSVNRTIWGASSLATALYVTFGVMGAMCFAAPGEVAIFRRHSPIAYWCLPSYQCVGMRAH
jgi:hypothetical protein